jgi:peptidoglycan/xylan/chitin deacetylase (PgdA/CDA1 family)
MSWSGLTSLLEWASYALPAKLIVLTYHRIAELSSNPFYDPVISATVDSFHEQVQWLQHHFRLLTLDEFIGQVSAKSAWREPGLLITFDDGYRDNFDVAVPILNERNIPAAFFIPTNFLEAPHLPWWDFVAYVIKQTQMARFTVQRDRQGRLPSLNLDLTTASRAEAIRAVIQAFLNETIADETWFLNQLAELAEVQVESNHLAQELFISWDQAQALAQHYPRLTVGSHGCTHHQLASLSAEVQYHELAESQQVFETRLGYRILALAYPYGWLGTYCASTKKAAAQAGYRVAFTSRPGVNWSTDFDQYEVRRLGIGHTDSLSLLRARVVLYSTVGWSPL